MKMRFLIFITLATVLFSIHVSTTPSVTPEMVAEKLLESKIYSGVKDYKSALRMAELLIMATENYTAEIPQFPPFPCQNTGRSPVKPTDARALKPADIDIVIAMGDSLTAGFGAEATNFFNLFTDYRGASFSIGGTKTVEQCSTLANLIQRFNPNVVGFSTGNGDENSANARLNVAVTGATSYELGPQVTALVNKLNGYDRQGWKILSFFIGGNDLCDACGEPDKYSAANYKANVEKALDAIQSNIPNIFVNLVLPPDVSLLAGVTGGLCGLLHPFECGCTTDPSTPVTHKQYVKVLEDLVKEAKYHNKKDFYVSVQPFLEVIQVPLGTDGKPDKTYFAPDCFHFSLKSHSAAGLSLWNNLMESAPNKKRTWIPGEPFECPLQEQFLQ